LQPHGFTGGVPHAAGMGFVLQTITTGGGGVGGVTTGGGGGGGGGTGVGHVTVTGPYELSFGVP
jgi:hypothetical protein